MKHTLLTLLLFITTIAGAQIVTIPDADFKNALLNSGISNDVAKDNMGSTIVVDVNNDDEIQESEALLVYELHVSGLNISSLEGINSFNNLNLLDCGENELDVLELALTSLEYLFCEDNNLATLGLQDVPNIQELVCNGNVLTNLDVSYLPQLNYLECGYNNIETINFGSITGLEFLSCPNNQISDLDLDGLINMQGFDCSNNLLPLLDLSGLVNLYSLVCNNNQLTELDFEGLNNISHVYCSGNMLTELDLSGTNIWRLSCSNNNITYINLKNGLVHDELTDLENDWTNNPLEYVCADEDELAFITGILNFNNYTNVNVNTYCSFTPGGDYNTITGTVTFDSNASGGCDAEDAGQMFVKINLNDGITQTATFTNTAGIYNFYTMEGDFTVTPVFENNWFAVTPVDAAVSFPAVDNSIGTENFCVTANGERNDVEVIMVPIVPAQPGQDAVYKIVYRNKGNQVLSGEVSCVWNPDLFGNILLSPPANEQAAGNYTWYYSNLLPFESREVVMTLEVNTPDAPAPVNVGDVLNFTADATPLGSDEVPQDNTFVLSQEVVGSYAGNSITCIEGEMAAPEMIGEYLHYVINFTNTGNATADFIVVTAEINPAYFDINSLQILNTSHDVEVHVNGNIIEFLFSNVNLAADGHGNILFKLKSSTSLQQGDNVVNNANIYFDYNQPVPTNDAITQFGVLNTGDFVQDASIKIYPNPSAGVVNITADSTIDSFELYDVQGRLLQSVVVNEAEAELDISQRVAGMYFVKVRTEKGIIVEKIVKK